VSSIIPAGFDAYARVLHPVSVERHAPSGGGNPQEGHSTEAWTWARIAASTDTVIHPQVQWIRIAGHQDEPLDLSGNRTAYPPPFGWLDPRILADLIHLAAGHTSTPGQITAALWEGWSIGAGAPLVPVALGTQIEDTYPAQVQPPLPNPEAGIDPALPEALVDGPFLELPERRYVLLSASAQELADPAWPFTAGIGWTHGLSGPLPQLIWPSDHAWAIASEIELDSTLIGGTFPFINQLMDLPGVEAVRVGPTTDLSWDADDLNRPS
jgi:hypothetical protein